MHAVAFFRSFFVTTFKDNDSIERGLITGITRISKEFIFSELNHLEVVTTISDKYATSFGFTEEEVFRILDELKLSEHKEGVKKWYDGFTFGKYEDIYNPWSIIAFISKKGEYAPYWANTSSNSLVSTLIQTGDVDTKKIVGDLMEGKSFTALIDEQIMFEQLECNTNAMWSLLLASGYLKMIGREPLSAERKGRPRCTLALTNMEVTLMFEDMVRNWFEMDLESSAYNDFIEAMMLDDVDYMNEFMNEIALNIFSNFDDTVANALMQIDEKQYETTLTANGFAPEQIRKYGFAFHGKHV